MNYSELSDFEINKLVAEKLGQDLSGVNETNQFNYNIADYCTNPEYSFPITTDNGISITLHGKVWIAWADKPVGCSGKTQVREFSYHENPQRAAMEVFLKIGDSE